MYILIMRSAFSNYNMLLVGHVLYVYIATLYIHNYMMSNNNIINKRLLMHFRDALANFAVMLSQQRAQRLRRRRKNDRNYRQQQNDEQREERARRRRESDRNHRQQPQNEEQRQADDY